MRLLWFKPKKSEHQKLMEAIMDAKTVILQAIADEKAQVTAAIEAAKAQIQALQDQLAAGSVITPEQLQEVLTSIEDIYKPAEEPPPAPPAV
jgi:DNA-binding protein H-NS